MQKLNLKMTNLISRSALKCCSSVKGLIKADCEKSSGRQLKLRLLIFVTSRELRTEEQLFFAADVNI